MLKDTQRFPGKRTTDRKGTGETFSQRKREASARRHCLALRLLCGWAAGLMMLLGLGGTGLGETAGEEDPRTVTYLDLGEKFRRLSEVEQILDGYPNLEKVDMFGTPVGWKSVEELEARYPGVEFGWTLKIGDHEVRTDATAFSTLHLTNSKTHGTKEISLFRYCRKLKALDFGHNGCDDISFLEELTDLRVLIIAINRVTDISPLAKLQKLEYLEIFNNYITDLSPLTGLTHLMDLNISYNNIQDLTPLYQMPWLKRLWMYRCTNRNSADYLPEETIEELKKHLPDTEINYKSMPTAGTWREHPHFDVIHAMFRSPDGYAPFEDSFPEDDDLVVKDEEAEETKR